MLSLRQLIAQQSSQSQEENRVPENSSKTDNNITKQQKEQQQQDKSDAGTSLSKRPAASNKAKKRKREIDEEEVEVAVKEEEEELPKKRSNRGDDESTSSSSSSGEEWFGDGTDLLESSMKNSNKHHQIGNDDDGDFRDFGEKYPAALSAIYDTATVEASMNIDIVNETLHPLQRKGVKFTSRLERLEPRTKRVKRNGETKFITERKEDAEQRVKRIDLHNERSRIRSRWKTRAINFTLEEDIGNAFENRARRLLEEEFRNEEREKKKKQKILKEEEQVKQEEREKGEDEDEIDSVDEQNALLDRLTQSQSVIGDDDAENNNNGRQDGKAESTDGMIPYKERMDYWEYGKAIPDAEDLQKYSYKDYAIFHNTAALTTNGAKTKKNSRDEQKKDQLVSSATKQKSKRRATKKELSLPFTVFMKGQEKFKFESYYNQYILPSNEGDVESLDRVSHIRYLRVLAARCLCGRVGNTTTENRLLQDLLSSTQHGIDKGPVSDFDGSQALLTLAHQRGANILYYFENVWKDPQAAARHLGLLDDLGGCTLKPIRLQKFFGSRRSIVGRRYKAGKRSSSHKIVHGLGLDHQRDQNMTSTQTINKSNSTIPSSRDMNVDPPIDESDRKPTRKFTQEELILPTSIFAHLPGTKAPIPSLPLEPPAIIFGPIDRHAKFFDKAKLDDVTHRIVVSTLLSRMTKALSQDDQRDIYEQLKGFLGQYVEIHDSKIGQLYAVCANEGDTPCVQLYRALMGYCSFLSSGCSIKRSDSESHVKVEQELDDDDDLYATESLFEDGMHQVADIIYDFLSPRIDHNGLLRFPRLHVVSALVTVCRSLPKLAADILSNAMEMKDYNTPLDLLKETLELMENREMIVSEKDDEDDTIDHASLEYIMHGASSTLQHCIQVDPLNVDYHLWHIGFLSACLLLCSGNKIGSGAHLYPSEREKNQGYFRKSPKHEIRQKLPKFDEMRIAVTNASKLLLELARYQDGSRIHQGIYSFLEWNEVIALLVADSSQDKFSSIKRIHGYHLSQWALKERSEKASAHPDFSRDLSFLALDLENKPGKIENWRNFVRELGPLKYKHGCDGDRAHRSECPNCKYLREGLMLDHEMESKVRSDSSWWGTNRAWWIDGLLQVDALVSVRYAPATKSVMQKLEKSMPEAALYQQKSRDTVETARQEDLLHKDIGWLPNSETDLLESQERTDKERSATYDSELPLNFLDACKTYESDDCDNEFKLPEFFGSNSQRLELVCYKMLIFCHLKCEDDMRHVELYMHTIIKACWDKQKKEVKESSDEFRALQWMCYVGIDVPKLARDSIHSLWKGRQAMARKAI